MVPSKTYLYVLRKQQGTGFQRLGVVTPHPGLRSLGAKCQLRVLVMVSPAASLQLLRATRVWGTPLYSNLVFFLSP